MNKAKRYEKREASLIPQLEQRVKASDSEWNL
jgi:hypothetical protein